MGRQQVLDRGHGSITTRSRFCMAMDFHCTTPNANPLIRIKMVSISMGARTYAGAPKIVVVLFSAKQQKVGRLYPGCGDFDFCGGLQDYGFANIRVEKDLMHVMIVRYDDSMLYKEIINPDGTTGGSWAVGPWQPCVSNKRERTVSCNLGDDAACANKEKPAPTMECGWAAGEWGSCEGNQRNRTVSCLEGSVDNPANCANQAKLSTIDPCGWKIGAWSECKDDQQTRTVECLSVDLVGCDGTAPLTSSTCGSATPSGPSPTPTPDADADEEKKGGGFPVWIVVVVLVAIAGGAVFYFKSNQAAAPASVHEQELTGTNS